MPSGTGSTLVLHPQGLLDITFDLSDQMQPYFVNLANLNLNEGLRQTVQYGEAVVGEGGFVAGSRAPLVPVPFRVVVSGSTRAEMLGLVQSLRRAVSNTQGGTLEYKPEDVPVGARSTFYHYLESAPPRLTPKAGNRWDTDRYSDGKYRVFLDVELMTQPYATSDPDIPVQFLYETSIHNEDGELAYHDRHPHRVRRNYVVVDSSYVKGDVPALTRMEITGRTREPPVSIGRLLWARRLGGLANLRTLYQPGIAYVGSWGVIEDDTRSGGSYQRSSPPESANLQEFKLRFEIADWEAHRGRVAVVVIARDDSSVLPTWQLRVSCSAKEPIEYTSWRKMTSVGQWVMFNLGEVELPGTLMSDVESVTLYVDVCVRRLEGNAPLGIDALALVYLDEPDGVSAYAQEIVCAGAGVEYEKGALVENLKGPLSHVVSEGYEFEKLITSHGPFLELHPNRDNRLDFLWQRRAVGEALNDQVDLYSNVYKTVARNESDENWSFGGASKLLANHRVEGSTCLWVDPDSVVWTTLNFDPPLDLSGFFPDGYIVRNYALYGGGAGDEGKIDWGFVDNLGNTRGAFIFFQYEADQDRVWASARTRLSVPWGSGAFDWSKVVSFRERKSSRTGTIWAMSDWWRAEAVDTGDPFPTKGSNPTGGVWRCKGSAYRYPLPGYSSRGEAYYTTGMWGVDGSEYLRLIPSRSLFWRTQFYPQLLLYQERTLAPDVRLSVRGKGVYDSRGRVGIAARCSDPFYNHSDMYAFELDFSTQRVYLCKYVDGSKASIADAVYSCSVDQWYYLGLEAEKTTLRCYVSQNKNDLFVEGNEIIEKVDSQHISGDWGLLALTIDSTYFVAHFDDIVIEERGDEHVPSDSCLVEIKGLHRTIYPFRE